MESRLERRMGLQFPPSVGDIVMCAFPDCFEPPEMVKTRAVIVISPKLAGRAGLAAIVPLSNTAPDPVREYHCEIPARLLPKCMQATGGARWAKCDMVYTLSIARLSLAMGKRNPQTKQRTYDKARLDLEHINKVRRCLALSLGIGRQLFAASDESSKAPCPLDKP